MTPGFYSYKIDLQCAYISIGVKLSQYLATCYTVVTYMVDTRLMMGAITAASMLHMLTWAIGI